ncbi:hypothetical protein BOTBODRAFT_34977 [Botryobasidium botryosum FD-172 SS1]|uniref:Endosomal/vacuolar adapter protein YPT35 n=1 Tax=Botryobasidium botryosum (strain FD-172 SS1) TaxID=930990 RepID=A0A067M8M8_BOTB1|nr:hypothetical protein BOTBODRAFT_34977 [Botryobasidium botryosum FD-172 SS1]
MSTVSTPSSPSSPSSPLLPCTPTFPEYSAPSHPFQNTNELITVIPKSTSDLITEESQLYDEFPSDDESTPVTPPAMGRPSKPVRRKSHHSRASVDSRSVFSNDIFLSNNLGESRAFARRVTVPGWTSVGDKLGAAYIVYDCAIVTKDGTTIHALKRYSAFEQLHTSLMLSLPRYLLPQIPRLPPKSALSRYRPSFLARRRRNLEQWLSAILLHPEVGASKAVRVWLME